MSKIIEATCVAGVVKVGGIPVPGVTVLSEGVGQSSGILVLDGETAFYIPASAQNLEDTLTQVITALEKTAAALTKIGSSLTSIGAVTGPAWTPPPTIASDVADITSKVAEITAAKTQLQTLKGQLI